MHIEWGEPYSTVIDRPNTSMAERKKERLHMNRYTFIYGHTATHRDTRRHRQTDRQTHAHTHIYISKEIMAYLLNTCD